MKFKELLIASIPHRRHIFFPATVCVTQVSLVPYLPIFYIPMETFIPTLIIVADDVFADSRPFLVIFWREDIIFNRVVFDSLTESEENLCPRINNSFQIYIGELEVIRFRVILICIKIREDMIDVHRMIPVAGRVVGSGIRKPCRLVVEEISGGLIVWISNSRTIIHGIHNLDRTYFL